MAGIVNIAGSTGQNQGDTFYRYKMPQLLTKIEGKGNGIKTVIPNMVDIAKALARPPTYPTKYFGCELGAQTTFDEKNERYIVNGAHDASRLRELLTTFIDKFVLCPACKNPETELYITKKEVIYRDCKACGHREDVDMKHKLTTFILRNPPASAAAGGKKGSSKKTKADKKAAAAAGTDSPKNGAAGEDATGGGEELGVEAGSDDELTRRIEAGAADISVDDKEDKSGWSVDTSAEAVKNRQKSLQAGVQGLLQGGGDDDDEGGADEDSPYSQFEAWVATEARDGGASDVDIYKKAADMGIEKKYKTMQYLVQGLFTPTTIVAQEEIERHAPLFKKMILAAAAKGAAAGSSEKHQKSILGGIEVFVGLLHPEMATESVVPRVLMAFYQADILDDEELLKTWATHVSKKYTDKTTCKKVRRASAKFIEWLDEDEEEEDDDDEEEEKKEDEDSDDGADSA